MVSLASVRRCVAVALALFALSAPAAGQQPSPSAIAAAKQLLQLKGALKLVDVLIPGIVESAKNSLLPTHPQLAKDLSEVADLLRREFAPRTAEVATEFATVYAAHFTEQEMKEVIAFFKTPTGQKFAADEPAVLDQALSRTQSWSNTVSEQVFARFRAEMKKRGHEL
jgi:hypothetical protein